MCVLCGILATVRFRIRRGYMYLTRILYVSYTYFKRIFTRIKQVPRILITLPLR